MRRGREGPRKAPDANSALATSTTTATAASSRPSFSTAIPTEVALEVENEESAVRGLIKIQI